LYGLETAIQRQAAGPRQVSSKTDPSLFHARTSLRRSECYPLSSL